MTHIQRSWALATVLAGALLGCVVALCASGPLPLVPATALALLALALLVIAARQARRP